MIYNYHELTEEQLHRLKHRASSSILSEDTFAKVSVVIENVRKNGDRAIIAATKEHDRVDLNSLEVSEEEIEHA